MERDISSRDKRHLAYWEHSPAVKSMLTQHNVAMGLASLAKVKAERGQIPDAIPLYKRELAILDGTFATDSESLPAVLEGYARALRKTGRADEARAPESLALTLRLGSAEDEIKRLERKSERAATTFEFTREHSGQYPRGFLEGIEENAIRSSNDLIHVLNVYAPLLRQAGRAAEADTVEARARSMSKAGPERPASKTDQPKPAGKPQRVGAASKG
jgi:hypothetical protein